MPKSWQTAIAKTCIHEDVSMEQSLDYMKKMVCLELEIGPSIGNPGSGSSPRPKNSSPHAYGGSSKKETGSGYSTPSHGRKYMPENLVLELLHRQVDRTHWCDILQELLL